MVGEEPVSDEDIVILAERVLMERLAEYVQRFLDAEPMIPKDMPRNHVVHLAFVAGFGAGLQAMNVPIDIADRVGTSEIERYGEGPDDDA